MHPTAMYNCQHFFATYSESIIKLNNKVKVIEIGSQDVNGTLRETCPKNFEYIGVDFVVGKGVDVVLEDPYSLPFETDSTDVVLSSSCFEHSEMFWIIFLEVLRILKPSGLFYLNAPSNGHFHRYPVDCWRFYPDSGRALITWAKRNNIAATLLESYTSTQVGEEPWNDFVAVFLKDETFAFEFPKRITDIKTDFTNGLKHNSNEFIKYNPLPEDKFKLHIISKIISNQIKCR